MSSAVRQGAVLAALQAGLKAAGPCWGLGNPASCQHSTPRVAPASARLPCFSVSPLPRLLTDRTPPPVGAPCTVCARTSWGSDRTARPVKPLPRRPQSLPCVRQQLRLEHTKPGTLGGRMCVINVVFRTAGETLSSGETGWIEFQLSPGVPRTGLSGMTSTECHFLSKSKLVLGF